MTAVAAAPFGSSMIYVFAFPGFFKIGYASCPYRRKAMGFWHNKHPSELCGRLDQCTLIHLFEGAIELEEALHKVLQGGKKVTEFYGNERLPDVLQFLSHVLEPLPLPADPGLQPWAPKLKPCCGGCNRGFQRDEHARRSYATKGQKAPCGICGIAVSVRHDKLKQHQLSKACAGKR